MFTARYGLNTYKNLRKSSPSKG